MASVADVTTKRGRSIASVRFARAVKAPDVTFASAGSFNSHAPFALPFWSEARINPRRPSPAAIALASPCRAAGIYGHPAQMAASNRAARNGSASTVARAKCTMFLLACRHFESLSIEEAPEARNRSSCPRITRNRLGRGTTDAGSNPFLPQQPDFDRLRKARVGKQCDEQNRPVKPRQVYEAK